MPRSSTIAGVSVNDELFSIAIRRAMLVERLSVHERKEIVRFLDKYVFPEVMSKLQNLDALNNRTARGRRRIARLFAEIAGILRTGSTKVRERLSASMSELGILEAEFWQTSLSSTLPSGLNLSIAAPNLSLLRAIVREPMDGLTLTQWFTDLGRRAATNVQRQVHIGLALGESSEQIVRRVRGTRRLRFTDGVFQSTRRQAATLVRTAVNHTATQARELVYGENEDVIKEVQIVATLDTRTTLICQSYDGEVHPVNEGPRPPFHPACRTTTIPITKSLKEMGFSERDVPLSTRESMNGQVPRSLSFGEWLSGQPTKIQNKALGPRRAALFRSGEVKIGQFTDPQHRPLTLAQLRVTQRL